MVESSLIAISKKLNPHSLVKTFQGNKIYRIGGSMEERLLRRASLAEECTWLKGSSSKRLSRTAREAE